MKLRFRSVICLLFAIPLAAAMLGCGSSGTSGEVASSTAGAPTVSPSVPPPPPPPIATSATATGARSIAQLLPADGATVDVMDGVMPDGLAEATAKFNAALQRDPEWWSAEVRKAGPGNAVPYNPKMGISQQEYDLIVNAPDLIKLRKIRSQPVSVRTDGNRITISGIEGMPELDEIEFDLIAKTMKTRWGEAKSAEDVAASPKQRKMTGPWNGYAWSHVTDIQTPNAVRLTVHLGELTESGRGMLFFDAKYFDAGVLKRPIYILHYDLPR